MRLEAAHAGFRQVMRHEENACGTSLLRGPRHFNGHARAVASTGYDRRMAAAGLDSNANRLGMLRQGQGEDLAGAARREQARRSIGQQPLEACAITGRVQIAIVIEVGQRERH